MPAKSTFRNRKGIHLRGLFSQSAAARAWRRLFRPYAAQSARWRRPSRFTISEPCRTVYRSRLRHSDSMPWRSGCSRRSRSYWQPSASTEWWLSRWNGAYTKWASAWPSGLSPPILFLVLREGLTLGVLGVSLGVAGALVVSRILGSMLYGTGVADPITYSAVSGMFLAIAMAASYVPARRAARLDPMAALRWE